ncbi:ubiquitin family protein [Striga asiatica]|uniref:Ubiquitin family protein n=1 Tax=Striga asiatica TaxID=4170 RepID=A0A5A7PIB6_STRAF|nr:ubiquitin family protein [Striga asiatica]
MESTGGARLNISGNDAAECSETTVEIKIKTLDSQTFTLRVDKCVPVPELKQQIASLTGVLSEQQRLICRGKVLKDDQLLSAYHVEDGHTLHLVVRQPIDSSPGSSDHPAPDPTSSNGHIPGNRVGPSVMVGSFNISEQGDGSFPDLNRIVSAVLNSFGVSRSGSGGEGIDLNQPPLEQLSSASGLIGTRNYSRLHSDQDQAASVAIPVASLQPPIIPDSLTTLLQYLTHLRQEFLFNAEGLSGNAQNTGFPRSDAPELEGAVRSSGGRGPPSPESLAEVISSARRLLVEQAAVCLSQLAGQLESESSVTDPLERTRIQSNAMRSGALFQNFGALFLELGRAIMTLRMGPAPGDAFVNAGPSIFVSSAGPNPIMVQGPLHFQPGALGSIPVGNFQHGLAVAGDSSGTGFVPRNIDIRIRAGSVLTRREPSSSQSVGQGSAVSPGSGNSGPRTSADPNLRRDPQVRAVPLRTVVAAVPSSVSHSDSSRGPIGILYPVLARVQNVSSGNSNGTGASQVPGQHQESNDITEQPGATQQQNFTITGRGEHVFSNSAVPGSSSGSIPSQPPAQESAPAASDEGVVLSNILRQIMPIVSQYNAGADVNQADDNQGDGGSSQGDEAEPSSKRQRLPIVDNKTIS